MAKKPEYFVHESLQDRNSLIHYLRALLQGIENGEVILADDDETLTLTPNHLTLMNLRASKTKSEQSLRLKLSWTTQLTDESDSAPLFIKSKKSKKGK
ncbi:MAG: amphi-Trp domain-containing protein [Thiotrichales bacterium]|nr:amphi-Trp domain-containing protein [Thiotrichales bacterium]